MLPPLGLVPRPLRCLISKLVFYCGICLKGSKHLPGCFQCCKQPLYGSRHLSNLATVVVTAILLDTVRQVRPDPAPEHRVALSRLDALGLVEVCT